MSTPATGYVIAIDNGSQSTKVLIVDGLGVVHASARVGLRPYASPAPGRWEHPDDDLWDSIVAAVRGAMAEFGGDTTEIHGIGLCTIRFCRAVLRADGSLAQPIMSWMDERLPRAYEREVDDAVYVTTSSGYLAHRLTGERRDAAGNVQGVWPIDTARWQWSEDAEDYARTGMAPSMLFELAAPGEVLGTLTESAAEIIGLPAGIPVIATANDKAVEALGAGLRDEGDVLLSLGTYVATMIPGDRPLPPHPDVWTNFASEPGRYLYESGGVRRGMWTVSWFRDLLSDAGAATTEDELNRGAESVPVGAGGLVAALDWLAPAEEPWRRGALVGFDGTQGRFHIYRAILEALAIETEAADSRAGRALGRRRRRLLVTGGGSGSMLMLRILAAVYGVPVRVPLVQDAAGIGAAICAAVGTGMHPTWEAAVTSMVAVGTEVGVDAEAATAYGDVRRRYEQLLPRVRRLFADEEEPVSAR
ncbi:FGGY-family carbohydrate kinase [Microbacterium sp. KSW4-16]|uniref:Sugar kinase n=1 Tax=Microbacterium aurugineum TaxID=2851642 RepID=A0ABY4J2N4_9MICO|nr:FGGY family carbohydrate kinase [Microbacterium aurugineum]MCK8466645.1 FGGY-family carbohydrate kinase [Microbacterium aurugineum]UPL18306.1 sugar kinase [Microbacterium aurugineum]